LAVSSDEKTIVSAGADSVATIWEDSTEVEQAEKNDALVKAVQRCVVIPPTFHVMLC
jgi:U3 small nucleolar RNA-associated protein 13